MSRNEFDYLKFKNILLTEELSKSIYDTFIEHCRQSNTINGIFYTEKHHILPKCIGGDDNPSNIVILSFSEHCFAHYLLAMMHPDNIGLTNACILMFDRSNLDDFSSLEKFRKLNSKNLSETNKKFFNDFYDRKIKSGRYKTYTLKIKNLPDFTGTRMQIKNFLIESGISGLRRTDLKKSRILSSIKEFINHIDRFCNENNQIFLELT